MSAVGDALAALKNVVLMQERMDVLRGDVVRITDDLKSLTAKVYNVNERLVRIETMIEMGGRGAPAQPQIGEN